MIEIWRYYTIIRDLENLVIYIGLWDLDYRRLDRIIFFISLENNSWKIRTCTTLMHIDVRARPNTRYIIEHIMYMGC